MMPVTTYIGLGSNLNDPEQQLQQACRALRNLPQSRLLSCSSLYGSHPLLLEGESTEVEDVTESAQPDYINAVAVLETHLEPLVLLDALQAIEVAQGRDRSGPRWGARTLDLDILLYGQLTLDIPRLCVPHPGLAEREFVLYPLYQIAPQLVMPNGQRLKDQVAECPLRGLQRLPLAELAID
jgi:2-amino-4-hydroxy-6-hydroxymethyldihydropteridine diphosphokinase